MRGKQPNARHLLTNSRCLTKLELMVAEKTKTRSVSSRTARVLLRQFVCLLLVGFFLYNPFVSLINSSNGLSVHQLARNRSTVGAGELQNFSPQSKTAVFDDLSYESIGDLVLAPTHAEFALPTEFAPLPLLQDFSSNLFFRPPPRYSVFLSFLQ